jgi:hypothetical protein
MTIPPEQCKAARELVGMDQITLAVAAQISRTTIMPFENRQAKSGRNNVDAIRRALPKLPAHSPARMVLE